MYRVARRLVPDPTEAEDLVAQALLNASRGWEGFEGVHARSWLLSILRNCLVQSRRAGRPQTADLDPDLLGAEPWSAADWRLVGPDLVAHLDRLPEEYRLAVALCDVEEMNYEEAASAMGVPVGTVKSRVFRGRRMLQASLERFMEETR